MTGFLLVCLGAAVGAPARYLTDRAIQARHDSLMPWGTLAVNVVGSLGLGLLVGVASAHRVPDGLQLLLGTGLFGALTTYSTFSYETLRLFEDGARLYAALNTMLNVVGALAAALIGYAVGAVM